MTQQRRRLPIQHLGSDGRLDHQEGGYHGGAIAGSTPPAPHAHVIGDVAGLQTALDGKASLSHTHAISAITGLQTTLDGKSDVGHTHAISAITGLQTALDGKSDVGHTHAISVTTDTTLTGAGTALSPLGINLGSANTWTANIGISKAAASSEIFISSNAGFSRIVRFQTALSNRWAISIDSSAESGTNVGSNFTLNAYDDSGTFIDQPIVIGRAPTASMTLTRQIISTFNGANIFGLSTGAANTSVLMRSAAGYTRALRFQSGSSDRWQIYCDSAAESGSDAGSVLRIAAYNDAGAFTDAPISISRAANGAITFAGTRTINCGNISSTGSAFAFGSAAATSATILGLRSSAGYSRGIQLLTGTSVRWYIYADTVAESGSDTGSALRIAAYTDAATFIDAVLTVTRAAAGTIAFSPDRPVAMGALTASGSVSTFGAPAATASTLIYIKSSAGYQKGIQFLSGNSTRWLLYSDSGGESGSDAGSAFRLAAYTDAGAFVDNPFIVTRAAGGTIAFSNARPVTMGALSATSGTFSGQLSMATTGNMLVGTTTGAATTAVSIRATAGQSRGVQFTSAAVARWYIEASSAAESGSDAGSAFRILAYTDAGAPIDAVLTITRASGGTIAWASARPVTMGALTASTISVTNISASSSIAVNRLGLALPADLYLYADASRDGYVRAYQGGSTTNDLKWKFGMNSDGVWRIALYSSGSVADVPISIAGTAGGAITFASTRAVGMGSLSATSGAFSGNVGFNGTAPIAKPTAAAASTDLATVITLANSLRTILINYGLAS